ncbi:4-hydroxy-3-methylbut-2-enyl diphosphate reductase [Amycolatopsis sp. NPDC059657]|uniref:4-hydroxy-3-methylbut-2-enyl diphosphate reductase n=1 Tax=Amycolatopsis sp. NPDC059657 TaxID=3346899 RepID=UPI00367334FA
MNRSVERRRFLTRGVPSGEVRVGWFDHPVRGPVRCSAAPLVIGSLRRRGHRTTESFLPIHHSGDAVLFTASYLDMAGEAVGIAASASAKDPVALAAAEEAIESWSAVWRTRRLLVAVTNPVCSGARRASRMVEDLPGEAYVIEGGPLESSGLDAVTVVGELAAVPPGGTVVFPPSGVPTSLRVEVADRGLGIVDTTCPLVDAMLADVRRFADRGDTVLIIGKAGHAAVSALAGEAPGATVLVESPRDIEALRVDPARVSYLISGGVPVEDVLELVGALRARFPGLRGQHPDGLCYAASDHLGTVRAVAAVCEVVLVLGAAGPASTRELADQAAASGAETHRLTNTGEIRPGWLTGAATVGLVTAPSAKPCLREEVIEALSGLGPLSVVRRTDVSEVVKIHGFR